jgi:hypothetical protein
MIPKDPSLFVFSILRDLYSFSEDDIAQIDPEKIGERLRGIHKGWSAEHEFAAIASWLGNPRLIVNADEVLVTDGHFRVPDFFVVARRANRDIPFLVEVKNESEDVIVWSESYLSSLRRFAQLLNVPLLIAWKRYGMWALVDSDHFTKKVTAYHLTFDCAVKNNLMTALFGNVFITIKEHFRYEIVLKLLDPKDAAATVLDDGDHKAQITDAALYTYKGRVPKELYLDLFPLFLAKATDESTTERDGEYLKHIFTTDPEDMFSASDLLFSNLSFAQGPGEEINWVAALRKGLAAPKIDLPAVLRRGIDAGAIQYVLEQQPEILPSFLEGIDLKISASEQFRGL